MKFWIRVNGEQVGPMDLEQLKGQNITPTTYVWCAGMKDWAYARDVADLQDIICYNNVVVTPPTNPVETNDAVVEVQEPTECVVEDYNEPDTNETIDHNEVIEEPKVEEEEDEVYEPINNHTTVEPATKQSRTEEQPCPPTNLVWSILITVLCCQPLGIVAVVLSAMVKSKYYECGYETAKKYSDWSAGLCIASIVLSILYISFVLPFSLMM